MINNNCFSFIYFFTCFKFFLFFPFTVKKCVCVCVCVGGGGGGRRGGGGGVPCISEQTLFRSLKLKSLEQLIFLDLFTSRRYWVVGESTIV